MFKKENKYLVLKRDDIHKYLSVGQKDDLDRICRVIEFKRIEEGKGSNSYIVVNEDEPYAEKVWELVRLHEEEKEQKAQIEHMLDKTKNAPKGSFFNP